MFPKISANKSQGTVSYGAKNLFPEDITQANSRSPVNNAIIRSVVTYICGKGVRDTAEGQSNFVGRPNPREQWDSVIKPIARDFKQFGGFYGQVILNKSSTTVSVFHQDFSTVRVGKIDETGNPLTFKIAYDWKKTGGKNKPLELELWPGTEEAEAGKAYMFYYWEYEPGLPLYCVPDWFAAIEYVKADGQLGEFYNNSIASGFTPSVVIEMPENPDESKREQFQRDMEDAFTGSGASSIIVLWGNGSAGEVRPKITPFNATGNADIYNNIEGIIFQKIISAHRLSSPTLAGVSGSGNLSGNAAEIIDAYVLFNYTVVNQMRRTILDTLNVFQQINNVAPLTIEELDVLPKIISTENPEQISTVDGGDAANSLAAQIGVGGTQALTAIVENPNLPQSQKRELIATLFGLDDATLDKLFAPKAATLQKRKPGNRLAQLFNKLLAKL